jgi:hypothetical protein
VGGVLTASALWAASQATERLHAEAAAKNELEEALYVSRIAPAVGIGRHVPPEAVAVFVHLVVDDALIEDPTGTVAAIRGHGAGVLPCRADRWPPAAGSDSGI